MLFTCLIKNYACNILEPDVTMIRVFKWSVFFILNNFQNCDDNKGKIF